MDAQGNTFLEPEIITAAGGAIVLKPWEDKNAFRTYGDDFLYYYGSPGEKIPIVKGIQVSGRDIKVEYLQNVRRLEASTKAGCPFCGMLRAIFHIYIKDISRLDGDYVERNCSLVSVRYHFELQVDLGQGNFDGGPRLRLHSIVVEYQYMSWVETITLLISASPSMDFLRTINFSINML